MQTLDPVAWNQQLRALSTPEACGRAFREVIAITPQTQTLTFGSNDSVMAAPDSQMIAIQAPA